MKEQNYRMLKDVFRDTDTRTLMSHLNRTKIEGTSMEKLIIEELAKRYGPATKKCNVKTDAKVLRETIYKKTSFK